MADGNTTPRWLLVLSLAAVAAGLYARFKGLGTWPFGIDEYYLSRSVDFILLGGLPEYPCGGYYNRGIMLQYIIAGLRGLGLTAELASRIVPALSSLAVLPAAWLLGRRLHSPLVGWLAVAVLSVSVWEVEMARFARMYAPFQAVFAWYLVYFLRFSVDRDTRAALPMLLLSVLGVFVWEGGILLGATNLLPVLLRHQGGSLSRRGWLYLVAALPLAALMVLNLSDYRYLSEVPPFDEAMLSGEEQAATQALLGLPVLSTLWLMALLVPAACGALALPWVWSLRHRWLAAAGVLLALAAALSSQVLLAFAIVLALLLLRMLDWHELVGGRARWFLAALAVCVVLWTAHAAAGVLQESGFAPVALLTAIVAQLSGITDVVTEIVRPWGATQPILTALIGLGLAVLVFQCVFGRSAGADIAALLVLIILLALAVGASGPPRHETRYTFFLFPLLVVLALTALASAASRLPGRARSPSVVALLALLLFGVSEDFRPRHLATIDSAETNFREGLSRRMVAHLYPRTNFLELAAWLEANAGEGDRVISGVPPVVHYYPRVAYSFLDEEDDRYFAYACQRGTVDRWSNLPLLYTTEALERKVAEYGRVLVVLYADRMEWLMAAAKKRGWQVQAHYPLESRGVGVLEIRSTE